MLISSIIPTHSFGVWLLGVVDNILDKIGLEHSSALETTIYVLLIAGVAVLIGLCLRRIILYVVQKIVMIHPTDMVRELIAQKVFPRCSHIIPPLVFMALIPIAFEQKSAALGIIERVMMVYVLIAFAIGVNSILTFVWVHYDSHENTNKHPLRGLLNTGHGIVWIVIGIIALSVLCGKSPTTMLAGLGAFAAALMLIFKDSILGFVAGIQLSQNDMLRVGDWICVPPSIANGIVEDVTLTVVKVRNWDNTLVMLPPYSLVSAPFQNWRGMFESGTREIARYVYFDNSSIVPIDSAKVDAIVEKFPILKDFVNKTRTNGIEYSFEIAPVNGTVDTNLGLFRAYMGLFLRNHPQISTEKYVLVRLQQANENGTPLQLLCYSKITKWTGYEAVQSEIFEHVAAVAPDFGLTIYNAPDRNSFELTPSSPAAGVPIGDGQKDKQ